MSLKGQSTATQMAGFKSCHTHASVYIVIEIINGASALLTSGYLAHYLINNSLQGASPATHWLAHWDTASKRASSGLC